jgi:hypothetical protein
VSDIVIMLDQLESLRLGLSKAVSDAKSLPELEEIETRYLSREEIDMFRVFFYVCNMFPVL